MCLWRMSICRETLRRPGCGLARDHGDVARPEMSGLLASLGFDAARGRMGSGVDQRRQGHIRRLRVTSTNVETESPDLYLEQPAWVNPLTAEITEMTGVRGFLISAGQIAHVQLLSPVGAEEGGIGVSGSTRRLRRLYGTQCGSRNAGTSTGPSLMRPFGGRSHSPRQLAVQPRPKIFLQPGTPVSSL